MTLKDKIVNALSNHVSLWATSSRKASESCAKIAEEEAVGFAEWVLSEHYMKHRGFPGQWLKYGCVDNDGNPVARTPIELFTLYQQEKEK